MMTPTTRQANPPTKRSPFWIIGGMLAAIVVLLVALAAVASMRPVPAFQVPGASVVTLPDGAQLFVSVTHGTRHSWTASVGRENPLERLVEPTQAVDTWRSTDNPRYMIWLSGVDPNTKKPLDVTWWAYSSVVDQYGDEVRDRNCFRTYHKIMMSGHSTSSSSAQRPMEPVGVSDADTIVACTELPLFHINQRQFTLRLHDATGRVVAQIPVPTRHAPSAQAWTPDALPATRADGDLSVTLTGTSGKYLAADGDPDQGPGWRLRPHYQLQWKGEPTDDWYVRTSVVDSLGNRAYSDRVEFSDKVPAWKLEMIFSRSENADFSLHEQWQLPMMPLPKPREFQRITKTGTAKGQQITLLGVSGQGPLEYRLSGVDSDSMGSSSTSGSLTLADGGYLQYSFKMRSEPQTTVIESSLAHLVFEVPPVQASDLIVNVVDDQGRVVPTRTRQNGKLLAVMLGLAADAQAIQPTVIVSGHRRVDFFVAPPTAEKPTPGP